MACKTWAANVDRCPNSCAELRKGNYTPSGFKHPVMFHEVGVAAFKELLHSPFWFARKFADGGVCSEADGGVCTDGLVVDRIARARRCSRKAPFPPPPLPLLPPLLSAAFPPSSCLPSPPAKIGG